MQYHAEALLKKRSFKHLSLLDAWFVVLDGLVLTAHRSPPSVPPTFSNNTEIPAFDFYELRNGLYKFGYYDCSNILQGGATDDMTKHYLCSEGIDLFKSCNSTCNGQMEDMTAFEFESTLFGAEHETATSQVFY